MIRDAWRNSLEGNVRSLANWKSGLGIGSSRNRTWTRRWAIALSVAAVILSSCGLTGIGSRLVWIEQHPKSRPSGLTSAPMAYDSATRVVVLLGTPPPGPLDEPITPWKLTWTWNGTDWTEQHPANSPPPPPVVRPDMAYDDATQTVVLFYGGVLLKSPHCRLSQNGPKQRSPKANPQVTFRSKCILRQPAWRVLPETWSWNGTTWAEQHPAQSPPPRRAASMAYDAATHQVVLFGGVDYPCGVYRCRGAHSTWTWNGDTWTKQHPTQSPPSRIEAQMAYDAATRQVVLFGGYRAGGSLGELDDTWTWNGANWTQQHPAQSPPSLGGASMAYDAATRQVVLFGGGTDASFLRNLNETWTWNGTTWTEQHPAQSPPSLTGASMAYDVATQSILLFGGLRRSSSETWTLRLNEALKGAARR
ncbi:MAG: Kelch repeat-containing protein [Acidimicrobiales bacterium]